MAKKMGIGLDIGNSSIKLVQVEGGNTITVNKFAIIPMPENCLNNGVINNKAAVIRAIGEAFSQTGITKKKAMLAVAGQAVIVRNIKIPLMPEAEIANAIRWEAERYIPFPADEVEIDYHVINRDEAEQEIELVLVCAHKDIVNSHILTLREAKVQPLSIDIQPFALIRAMGLDSKASASIGILDIGAGTTDLTIIKDGIPRFTRIIPLAGQRLTENISRSLGASFTEAEELKKTLSDAYFELSSEALADPEEFKKYKVNMALQEGLQELVLELRRSFDYYQLQQKNEEVSQLIVAGGGSHIANLIPHLNQELGLAVNLCRPRMDIICSNNKLQEEYETNIPILTVALGLALREVVSE